MGKKMLKILMLLFIQVLAAVVALAHEGGEKKMTLPPRPTPHEESSDRQIPEQVIDAHWDCKEIAELGEKYEADKKLPEGSSCSKSEWAHGFLAILDKVVESYNKEGPQALLRDDPVMADDAPEVENETPSGGVAENFEKGNGLNWVSEKLLGVKLPGWAPKLLGAQFTGIHQIVPPFHSPYEGEKSLRFNQCLAVS